LTKLFALYLAPLLLLPELEREEDELLTLELLEEPLDLTELLLLEDLLGVKLDRVDLLGDEVLTDLLGEALLVLLALLLLLLALRLVLLEGDADLTDLALLLEVEGVTVLERLPDVALGVAPLLVDVLAERDVLLEVLTVLDPARLVFLDGVATLGTVLFAIALLATLAAGL